MVLGYKMLVGWQSHKLKIIHRIPTICEHDHGMSDFSSRSKFPHHTDTNILDTNHEYSFFDNL